MAASILQKMKDAGSSVVFGSRRDRVTSPWSDLVGKLCWTALNLKSNVRIPHNPMTCRLMTRRFVDALVGVEDRVLYLADYRLDRIHPDIDSAGQNTAGQSPQVNVQPLRS